MTTSSTRSCLPLLGALHCGAGAGWHWPMPPSSRPNTSNLRKSLSNQTLWIYTPHHQHPHTPAETAKAIHSRALMWLVNLTRTSQQSPRNLTRTLQVLKPTIYTMATPPLETIPEETPAPAPTPARVTADPPKMKPATEKNPGRVASGKRLAERNRLAREAKKKAEAETARATAQLRGASATTTAGDTYTPAQSGDNSISLMTMLGIGGLLVSAAGVYYQREAIIKSFKSTPQAAAPQATTPPAPASEPTPAPHRPHLAFR